MAPLRTLMRPVGDNAVMRRFNVLVVQPDDYVNYAPFLGVADGTCTSAASGAARSSGTAGAVFG